METTQKPTRSTQAIAFLLYLTGGLAIFALGANTFDLYATNRNAIYEWGLTMALLLLAVILQRVASLRIYARIAGVLFIAAAANAVNLAVGNFLKPILPADYSEMQFLAIDKLSQAVPIVATIVLLSLWSGDHLGGLFLQKGKLRQGLGLVNAYMMLKTDSIWGSVFFHAGYDLLVILPLLVA